MMEELQIQLDDQSKEIEAITESYEEQLGVSHVVG